MVEQREESDPAWKVSVLDLLGSGCNLDRKNPSVREDAHLPPKQLVDDILKKEQSIAAIMADIKIALARNT